MDKKFLYELLTTQSVSGDEVELQRKVMEHMKDYAEEIITDTNANVICIANKESKVKVMLAAHIDEIGLMITYITDSGMLKVNKVGGIRPSMYVGHKVAIKTRKGIIYGAVCSNRNVNSKPDLVDTDLTIDIGADSREDALEYVSLGDVITFDTEYRELVNDRITARAIDNRGGAFIILEAFKKAVARGVKCGVYCATTTGEETTMRGAFFASQKVKPDMAIAVDVTYATDYEGTSKGETGDVRLSDGAVVCNSTIINKKMNQMLIKGAEENNIKYQIEAAVARTGTDIDKIHFSNDGVPTALVSLPLRYMHSPSEVADYNDIEACIDMLVEFLMQVDENTNLNPFA